MKESIPNRLYFGDCLDVMREDIKDESVDLIYLDPPFNSKRIYNASMGGAQWVAFEDTWRWHEAIDDFEDVAKDVSLAGTFEGLRHILGEGANLAYLSYMGNRLRECKRVLKPTGSIYLHCDPTMSHYLKIVMDGIFEKKNFLNEIIWCYSIGGKGKKGFGKKHDVIFRYSKTKSYLFNYKNIALPMTAHKQDKKGQNFGGKMGVDDAGLKYVEKQGTRDSKGNYKYYRYYLDAGKVPEDWWIDINTIQPSAKERVGYPTQKPLALLDRIIKASSNEGDVVFDPFCGCGTTIHASQNLNRHWIGIDVCVKACQVIEQRIKGHFDSLWSDIKFIGMPKTVTHAHKLAELDKFRFERWAASLVDGMEANKKQRGDGGIDGHGRIAIRKGQFIDLVSQVKGGHTNPSDVQAFNGARQQVGADLGIFTCFENKVTHGMRNAAISTGRFMDIPTIQIYTVEDYFEGRRPSLPLVA